MSNVECRTPNLELASTTNQADLNHANKGSQSESRIEDKKASTKQAQTRRDVKFATFA